MPRGSAGDKPGYGFDLAEVRAAVASPAEAIARRLDLLVADAAIEHASLWARAEGTRLTCVAAAGGEPSRAIRAVASTASVDRRATPSARQRLIAVAVGGGAPPPAALAARAAPGRAGAALELLERSEPLLAIALEQRELLAGRESQAETILATERRLIRFGLDLHDGPTQEAAALLSDLRLFSDQLAGELADHPRREILLGRAQDLELRAFGLEAGIRELARTAGGRAVFEGSMAATLRDEARAFALQTGIIPALSISGDPDEATDSQRITLLRCVQEALRNAREHSDASQVSVRVTAPPGRLQAVIEDNGRGFHPKRTLGRARRQGRIGLSGIEERARLLGGTATIRSRPGGPTAIAIDLPRWGPGDAAQRTPR